MEAQLTRRVPKAAPLFVEGEPCDGAWLLIRGQVALSICSGGKQLTITYAHPGAVLGLAEALGDCKYRCSAVAVSDITVHFISTADIRELMVHDGATAMELLMVLTQDLHNLYDGIRRMELRTADRTDIRASARFDA